MATYNPYHKIENFKYPIDFFARRVHFIDHLEPVWHKIDRNRGSFYVLTNILEYAQSKDIDAIPLGVDKVKLSRSATPGSGPIVTCAYNDMEIAFRSNIYRPLILMEHGVGLIFGHPGYAGGTGLRNKIGLFLAPNSFIYEQTNRTYPTAEQVLIGTPKLDKWANKAIKDFRIPHKPVLAISFHWDGSRVAPEAGNAFKHYKDIIPELARHFKLLGHGHPKFIDKLSSFYNQYNIEVVRDFEEVMERADIYINDCSSTLYEFCVTGKPVIILNAPWFRENCYDSIRFWRYTDIGPMVNDPKELIPAVDELINKDTYKKARAQMVKDLYPNLGYSADIAADAIMEYCERMKSKNHGTTTKN